MKSGASSNRRRGALGEDVAAAFLRQNGYEIVEQNYYHQHGEIDIIAREGKVLVFVEVKARRSDRFGAPEEAVTPKKQEMLRRTAEGYIVERNIGECDCRFDVVAVMMSGGTAECRVLKDCF